MCVRESRDEEREKEEGKVACEGRNRDKQLVVKSLYILNYSHTNTLILCTYTERNTNSCTCVVGLPEVQVYLSPAVPPIAASAAAHAVLL